MPDTSDRPTFNTLGQWLEEWGFVRHPFEQLMADDDEYLENYFRKFPYFNVVKEPKCTFLFLERGAGKSANKRYLQILCDKSLKQTGEAKLGVAYTDFYRLFQHDQVTLADHVDEILREAVSRLYDLMLKSPWQDLPQKLSPENKKYFFWFIARYSEKFQPKSIAQQIYQIQDWNDETKSQIITGELKLALDLLGKSAIFQDLSQNLITDTKLYNLKNIRTLLIKGFTAEELIRLCQESPDFRPVYEQFTQATSKDKIIDQLIDYADKKLQLDTLLALVQELNPPQFEEYQPYYQGLTMSPTLFGNDYGKPQISKVSAFNDFVATLQLELQEIDNLKKFNLSPLKLMARFADIARELNIKHIYILVDRVNEYNHFGYTKVINMLKPLLEAGPLFEMPAYAFKFFLPLEMRDELAKLADHMRSGRSRSLEYTWRQADLEDLLKGRLEACRDKSKFPDQNERQSFVSLFELEVGAGRDIIKEMTQYANGSPRNLLKLAKMIFEEHSDPENFPLFVSGKTYQKVLSIFASEQLRDRALNEPLIGQLARLRLSDHSTLAYLLNRDLGIKDGERAIKKWQERGDNFHAPHFSLTDIVDLLDISKDEAREIVRKWEDKGLISIHCKITDENLARYLFTQKEEGGENDS
jgi:hypothetical protein